jgi:putative tryptophan/tyrosine transport system substrate-binding protein
MNRQQFPRSALGVLPLPTGERVGVRGFEAHRKTLTPHPIPLPAGEGADRALGGSVGMKRRAFLSLLAGAAAAWPLAARAQQPAMPVIGFLSSASAAAYQPFAAAFRQGLGEIGYVEGRNVAIEYRWADNQYDRLPALAAELVRRQVDVIAANGPAALPAKAATTTIPIVFAAGFDPVDLGLVSSLHRPGGNVTGTSMLNVEVVPKRLQLLNELVPAATVMALLVNPSNPNAASQTRDLQAAARTLGLQLHILHASSGREFDAVFAKLHELRAGGLVIGADAFFNTRSEQLAALALRHTIPAAYQYREFTAAGGLMSYAGSITDSSRHAGVYTGRILKGEKPGDLPVQRSTKLELFLNLKTAKALGLTVPLPLIGRADEVIE